MKKSLIIWIVSLISMGWIIGTITKPNIDDWYIILNRSSLTPPNYLFGIVWSILYTLIAISGWIIWKSRAFPELKSIKTIYVIQLILNWSWSLLFFNYKLIGIALICIILIVFFVANIIFKSRKNLTSISFLLMPYLIWVTFATYLNLYIWLYN